jgi:Protein of unknown function (DUF1194)
MARKLAKSVLGLLAACALISLTLFHQPNATAQGAKTEVDVILALGVDISYSMDLEEQRLQREGYIRALTSPDVLQAIAAGPHAKIAVIYYEWAGANTQRVVVPWQVIDGPETADAFVAKLAAAPISRWYRTSVSGAILYGQELIETSNFRAPRRVLDISGDGANNHGSLVVDARDRALQAGIVINGLPIMIASGRRSVFDMEDLDDYYTDCVIGGPGAFMIAIKEREQFVSATRAKILREIASLDTQPRVMHASDTVETRAKMDCAIGEKQWEQRYRN